jgi:hypothetical protein
MDKVSGGSQYLKSGKTHYQANKAIYMAGNRRRVDRNKEYVIAYKKTHPCVDCGNADYRVLDFDHLPEFQKAMHVSVAVANGWSLQKIQSEIDKCEVRCANCHRIKTWERTREVKI